MHISTILYLLFIALINSFDNIGIRVAYSIGGVKVQFFKNILISLMAFAVSFTASLSGHIISDFLSEEISSILSMLLLLFTGLKIAAEPFMKKEKEFVNIKFLSYKESVSIGIALALDDIGGSIGVGLVGYSPLAVGLAFFTVSFLIFLTGNYMIKILEKLKVNHKIATVMAGLVMIVIGISQVIE